MTKIRFLETFIAKTGKTEFPVLTVMQPYAQMLLSGHKTKEYRNWRLPVKYIDEWILIHAGRKAKGQLFVDPIQWENFIFEYASIDNLTEHAIIGAVKFGYPEETGYVKYKYAWTVTDCIEFAPEIPNVMGKQRIWHYKIAPETYISQQKN